MWVTEPNQNHFLGPEQSGPRQGLSGHWLTLEGPLRGKLVVVNFLLYVDCTTVGTRRVLTTGPLWKSGGQHRGRRQHFH